MDQRTDASTGAKGTEHVEAHVLKEIGEIRGNDANALGKTLLLDNTKPHFFLVIYDEEGEVGDEGMQEDEMDSNEMMRWVMNFVSIWGRWER